MRHRPARYCQAIAPKGQGFPASVETVIVAKGDGTAGRYRHVNPIAMRSLMNLELGLQIARRQASKFFLLFVTAFTVMGQETC